jgi:hypothetical protein
MRVPSRCTGPPALDTLPATTLYAPNHATAWNDQCTQSSELGAYRATVGEPFKKKANAVFPSLEAVCGPLPFANRTRAHASEEHTNYCQDSSDPRGTGRGRRVSRGRLGGVRFHAQSGDSFEEYPAMTNRTNADFLQVL